MHPASRITLAPPGAAGTVSASCDPGEGPGGRVCGIGGRRDGDRQRPVADPGAIDALHRVSRGLGPERTR